MLSLHDRGSRSLQSIHDMTPSDQRSSGPRQRLAFWSAFAEHMAGSSDVRCCRPSMDTWMTHGGDINFGLLFSICRTRIHVVGAQFALKSVTARPIFYYLAGHGATIDGAFDTQPIWRSPVESFTALVEVRRSDGIDNRATGLTCSNGSGFNWKPCRCSCGHSLAARRRAGSRGNGSSAASWPTWPSTILGMLAS